LIAAADPHILPAIGFMLGGGCRSSEALGAQITNFYPATAELWLPDTKNGRPRMVQLPARARDLVIGDGLPDTGPICRTPRGRPYVLRTNGGGQIAGAFKKACIAADLDPARITPHILRHTWATWFYAQTKDFGGLLDIGGWQKSDMAQRYRKIAPADLATRLHAHGWDFSALGEMAKAATPKAETAPTQNARFRVIK
jgi:integrase